MRRFRLPSIQKSVLFTTLTLAKWLYTASPSLSICTWGESKEEAEDGSKGIVGGFCCYINFVKINIIFGILKMCCKSQTVWVSSNARRSKSKRKVL